MRRRKTDGVMVLCALFAATCVPAGELETGSLTVMQDARFYGELKLMAASAPVSGLDVYYSFASDETNTVSDLSGNSHTATVTGAIWSSSGAHGGSMQFDGDGDRLALPKAFSDLFCGTNDFSIAFWFKVNSGWSESPFLLDMQGERQLYVRGTSSQGVDFTMQAGGSLRTVSATGFSSGEWYHWVGTYDADGGASVYVDGAFVAGNSAYGAISSKSESFNAIGASSKSSSTTAFLDGGIDEFRFYDRALSAQEVGDIYYGDLSADNPNPGQISVEQMVITNGIFQSGANATNVFMGRVGIGTATPASQLHVVGAARFEGGISHVAPLGDISMGVYTNVP